MCVYIYNTMLCFMQDKTLEKFVSEGKSNTLPHNHLIYEISAYFHEVLYNSHHHQLSEILHAPPPVI